MPTPPTPIPSPGAARAAEAARLGRLVEAFPYRSHNRVTELALGVFGTIVFGAVAVLALGSAEGRFWAVIAGPLAVLSALVAVASARGGSACRASAASASSSPGPTSRGSWWPTVSFRCWRRAG